MMVEIENSENDDDSGWYWGRSQKWHSWHFSPSKEVFDSPGPRMLWLECKNTTLMAKTFCANICILGIWGADTMGIVYDQERALMQFNPSLLPAGNSISLVTMSFVVVGVISILPFAIGTNIRWKWTIWFSSLKKQLSEMFQVDVWHCPGRIVRLYAQGRDTKEVAVIFLRNTYILHLFDNC